MALLVLAQTIVFALLVIPESFGAWTSTARFERLSLEQGLSQSVAFAIYQDRQDYLWFGTEDGLNRYDGYSVTVFRHRENDSTSLSSSSIRCMGEDSSGNLWVGTWNGGLNRYQPASGTFCRYRHDPRDSSSISNDRVVSILCDSKKRLWISTWGGGLNLYEPSKNSFRHFRSRADDPGSVSTDDLYDLLESRSGKIWIGSFMGGLNVFDPESGTFRRFVNVIGNAHSLSDNRVTAMCEDSSGAIWIGTWGGGLNCLDAEHGRFTHVKLDSGSGDRHLHDIITSMHLSADGKLWIGTLGGGLAGYDVRTREYGIYRNDPNDPSSLADDKVFSIFEDNGGILWIGTGYGVSKYDPRKQGITHFRRRPGLSNSLSSNDVFPIHQDSAGSLWIGTYGGGLNRYSPATNSFQHFHHDPADNGSLGSEFIYALAEDKKGNLWIGSDGAGVDCLPKDASAFRHFRFDPGNPRGLRNDYIRCLLVDRQDVLWIGTGATGIQCYDPVTGNFQSYRHNPDDPHSLGDDEIQCFFEDHEETIWIGTVRNGLQEFDRHSGTFSHYSRMDNDSASLSSNHVQVIAEDSKGVIWVGTNGGGLNRLIRERGKFRHYGEREGLPNEVIYGILEDREGFLWMSTNKGLARFRPETGECRSFDINDGLQSNEFNYNAYALGKDGTLYFGGVNGFNAVQPERLSMNLHVPRVVLTTFMVMNVQRPDPSMQSGVVELASDQNFFSFEFAALDFSSPLKNVYSYKLEGVDPAWVTTRTRRYVNYAGVRPGSYIFRVRGSNGDGIWNEQGISVRITVSPPFWQTWWFRLGVFCSAASVLFLLYRLRVSKIVELERMRTRIASDLHDDIGSTLTKITVQSEMIQTLQDEERIRTLSREIGNASREIISMLSDIIWSIDARKDTLGDLFTRMQDFGMDVLTPRQILIRFEWDRTGDRTNIPFNIRQNLYLIFKEAINNIARHSDARNVVCRWTESDNRFRFEVEDDGAGMREQTKRGGFGLHNMKMRAGKIGANFELNTERGVKISVSGISL